MLAWYMYNAEGSTRLYLLEQSALYACYNLMGHTMHVANRQPETPVFLSLYSSDFDLENQFVLCAPSLAT